MAAKGKRVISGFKRRGKTNTFKAEFCTNIILKIEVITNTD